ncbi:CbrC family protein [Micromonospora sp. NPDC048839]|uniref:CbrC family protein n=1 Tax=Micromonospora sp. NPDC048839 TaxID=3155641 RepID=UPI0033EA989E
MARVPAHSRHRSGRRSGIGPDQDQARCWSAEDKDWYLRALSRDGPVTAYLFRCRHCGSHLAYSDSA